MTTFIPARVPYSPAIVGPPSSGGGVASAAAVNDELRRIQRQQTGLFQPRLVVYGMGGNPSPYVVRATDWLILVDATNGAIAITFPDAARLDGLLVTVVKVDASANAVTLTATINGVVNPTLATQYASKILQAGQGGWYATPRQTAPDIGPGKFPAGNYEFPNDVLVDGALTVLGASHLKAIDATGLAIPMGKASVDSAANTTSLQVSSTRTTAALNIDAALETLLTAVDIRSNEPSTGGAYVVFTNSSNNNAGSITHSGTTTVSYNTSSDRDLKRPIARATKPKFVYRTEIWDFEWLDGAVPDRGVFAQDAQHVAPPGGIHVGDDTLLDREGGKIYPWGADPSKWVWDLVVAAQDHEARVTALEAELAALRASVLAPLPSPPRSSSQEPPA